MINKGMGILSGRIRINAAFQTAYFCFHGLLLIYISSECSMLINEILRIAVFSQESHWRTLAGGIRLGKQRISVCHLQTTRLSHPVVGSNSESLLKYREHHRKRPCNLRIIKYRSGKAVWKSNTSVTGVRELNLSCYSDPSNILTIVNSPGHFIRSLRCLMHINRPTIGVGFL